MPDLLIEVNARVRELADSQSAGTARWDFRCKCGEPDCRQGVSLTVAEYEWLREASSPILAAGHEPCRARVAREESRELRSESHALRQQARLQTGRARRNRDLAARRRELICDRCGYGISVIQPPERCPMCSSSQWRPR